MTTTPKPQISPPPETMSNEVEHRRQLARAIANLYRGKGPSPVDGFTLATSTTVTTLTDARIGYYSIMLFMPQTADAAAELAHLYVSQSTQVNGSAVVTHSSATSTDRTFRVLILG